MLRKSWGLNRFLSDDVLIKNRDDHRHHAVDAFLLSLMNRKMIEELSLTIKLNEQASLENLLKNIKMPYDNFNEEVFKAKFEELKKNYIPFIANDKIREMFFEKYREIEGYDKATQKDKWKEFLAKVESKLKIRRLRLHIEKEKNVLISIKDKEGIYLYFNCLWMKNYKYT